MYHQFEAVEFCHHYFEWSHGFNFLTYWQQIDTIYAKMDEKKWTITVDEAVRLANDIGLIGIATKEWEINEAHALTKVYEQDERYEYSLSRQLGRLKHVIETIGEKTSSPRIVYTLEWLETKTNNIIQTWRVKMKEFRRFARHQAFD